MKANLLIITLLALCASAQSRTLSTTDGATYDNITTQRVDPDGLFIEYTLPGGGLGMSKIKFARLSPDQQKQFGFDAAKAREYEAGVAKATEDFRQAAIHDQQIAQAARQVHDAQNEKAIDDRINNRIIAEAQLRAAEADLARASGSGDTGNYGWSSGGGYGLIGIPRTGRVPPARRDYAPIVRPIPFPVINTPHSQPGNQSHVTTH